MTFKEFKEIIERNQGFQVVKDGASHKIINKEGNILAIIGNFDNYTIDTLYSINETDIHFLANNWHTISTYISTPIEDRYPVKKYYVKLDLPEFLDKQNLYLNRAIYAYRDPKTSYTFDTKNTVNEGVVDYQTQFTMEEIEKIIPEEDMDKFKIIPVEEED